MQIPTTVGKDSINHRKINNGVRLKKKKDLKKDFYLSDKKKNSLSERISE